MLGSLDDGITYGASEAKPAFPFSLLHTISKISMPYPGDIIALASHSCGLFTFLWTGDVPVTSSFFLLLIRDLGGGRWGLVFRDK
jgi:hypothetical protein